MSNQFTNEPLLDMFLFETSQLLEQLEQAIISSEKESDFSDEAINLIFRIMHTIKGSASMMLFDNIARLAHSIEDLFFYIRKEKPSNMDCSSLSDLILEGVDFIKVEVDKIKDNLQADGNANSLIQMIIDHLAQLKQNNQPVSLAITMEDELPLQPKKQQYYIRQVVTQEVEHTNVYKAIIHFEEDCEMENMRAYTVIHNLKDISNEVTYIPANIIDSDESVSIIRRDGFQVVVRTELSTEKMYEFFSQTIFLKDLEFFQLESDYEMNESIVESVKPPFIKESNASIILEAIKETTDHIVHKEHTDRTEKEVIPSNVAQSIISVSVPKLDKLMDLVGEMVIAEAMVIENPDLKGIQLVNFKKAARQLNKITTEIQDMVMSIRMVPLSATFVKMHRVLRDMSKKLEREVTLDIIGEETEVDKNIIEHISDPLMHLVRNSIDHGIESPEERVAAGKSRAGTIILEAKNAGSDVVIIVRDDGKGLNKAKILKKASENDLLYKNEEDMTEKEIFNLILLPGFSTKEAVTEFSGRGVGMDVVRKNIEAVGGTLSVDSIEGRGTVITLKIPLTLAIIDGMNIKVGKSRYTIPTIAIKESFRPKNEDIIQDPDGNEMIMVRGKCYLVKRLHELFKVSTEIKKFSEGIMLMIEQDDQTVCVFADALLGQQQVVVKALPQYIQNFKKMLGLAGCTLLGDGSISLIIDVARLVH